MKEIMRLPRTSVRGMRILGHYPRVPRGKPLSSFIYLSFNMVDPAHEIGLVKPAILVRKGGRREAGFRRIIYSIFESCRTASNP